MFELVIMEESFVNNSWALIQGLMVAFMVISGIAVFWANKVRNGLKNSTNANAQKIVHVIDDYVLPILKQGQDVAEATQKQEVKALEALLEEMKSGINTPVNLDPTKRSAIP